MVRRFHIHKIIRSVLAAWDSGTLILSPRNLTHAKTPP